MQALLDVQDRRQRSHLARVGSGFGSASQGEPRAGVAQGSLGTSMSHHKGKQLST